MRYTVKVPQWGDTIIEVVVLRWLIQPGSMVAAGDPIAELETDKVEVELEAPVAGTVAALLAQEGDRLQVGEQIAVLETD